MLVINIRAGTEIAHQCHRAIYYARERQVQRAQRARAGTDCRADFRFRGEYQRAGDLLEVSGLDFVEFVVTAHDQSYQLALFNAMYHQCFHRFFDGQSELLDELDDGLGVRRIHQAQLFAGRCAPVSRGMASAFSMLAA